MASEELCVLCGAHNHLLSTALRRGLKSFWRVPRIRNALYTLLLNQKKVRRPPERVRKGGSGKKVTVK